MISLMPILIVSYGLQYLDSTSLVPWPLCICEFDVLTLAQKLVFRTAQF